MELGTKVKVINPNQINYPLEGKVIEKEVAPTGLKMSKVKFTIAEVWYDERDLKEI